MIEYRSCAQHLYKPFTHIIKFTSMERGTTSARHLFGNQLAMKEFSKNLKEQLFIWSFKH